MVGRLLSTELISPENLFKILPKTITTVKYISNSNIDYIIGILLTEFNNNIDQNCFMMLSQKRRA